MSTDAVWVEIGGNGMVLETDFVSEKALDDNMSDSTSNLPLNDDQIWMGEEPPPDAIPFYGENDETEELSQSSSVAEKDLSLHELNAEKLAEMAKKMAQKLILL